jgi:integrase
MADAAKPGRRPGPGGQRKRGPERKGSLYWTKSGWRARLRVDVDGEVIHKSFDLDTHDKQVARIKLRKLVKQNKPPVELETEAKALETFMEAAERIVNESVIQTKGARLGRLRLHAFPALGSKRVNEITAGDVRELLNDYADKGASKQSCIHLRNDISAVLGELWRNDMLPEKICAKVRIPKQAKVDNRERAVLREDELVLYLAWSHPEAKKQPAVLERQTAACVSWFFGGLRWSDIRVIRWEAFETEQGRFGYGWAPRKKSARPQALIVPEVLRPILRDYWERAGRPTSGLVFPVRKGKRAGEERKPASIARYLRRDLRRAFGLEIPQAVPLQRSNGRRDTRIRWIRDPAREMTTRERELFEPTQFTRPVDFHSFRRAFKQGLVDADIDVQRSMKLSGATDLAAHARYVRNTSKPALIPSAALPQLSMSHAQFGNPTECSNGRSSVFAACSSCRRSDLNRRLHAYEACALTG